MAVLLYAGALLDGGVEYAGAREVAAAPGRAARYGAAVLGLRVLLGAVVAVVLALVGVFLLPQPEGGMLAAYGFALLATGGSARWILLGLDRPGAIAIARVAGELLIAAIVLVGVRSVEDLTLAPVAHVAGEGVLVILLALFLRRAGLRVPLRFGRWRALAAHTLLGLLIFNSDFVVLRLFGDARDVGLYAAAYTIISFAINLGGAYGQSLLPALTRAGRDAARQVGLYHQSTAQLVAVGLPFAVGGTLLAGEVMVFLFGAGYGPAADALRILLWSVPVALLRTAGMTALVSVSQHALVLRTTTWGTGVNLVLNFALIPVLGLVGAAAATLVTELLRMTLALRFASAHALPLLGGRRCWPIAVASAVMALALVLVPSLPLLARVAVGIVAYGVVFVALGGLRRGEDGGWSLAT